MSTVHLSAEQTRAMVCSVFPDMNLVSCVVLPGGHRNVHYAVTLSDGSRMVLKVYAGKSNAAACSREAHLLRTITAETGVPVPRLLGQGAHLPGEEAAESGTHPWALLSWLPGKPLLQTIDLLEEAELEAVAYELGRYLAHLHQVPLALFGGLLEAEHHAYGREKAHVLSQASEWLQSCEEQGLLAQDAAARLRDRFEQTVVMDRQQPCLVHADLSARKVIVEPGYAGYHVTGLVGWTNARGGSPERDVAGLFAWDLRPQSAAQKGLLDGYTESAELPPHFWERLDLYEVFVSLKALLVAHRTGDMRVVRLATQRLSHPSHETHRGGGRGNSGTGIYV